MKKRLIISVLCLVVSFTVCITAFMYLKHNTKAFIDKIDVIIAKINNDESNADDIDDLLLTWKQKNKIFGILLKHSDADNIDKFFILIENYMRSDQTDELMEALIGCKAEFFVMLDGERPVIENIF